MNRIYLDYAAATPLDPRVRGEMDRIEAQIFANASSLHQEGRQARDSIDEARLRVADFLRVKTSELIFTSGATESNILALRGVIEYRLRKGDRPHIVVSKIEHPSLRECALQLEASGVEVSWIDVDANGLVLPEKLQDIIKDSTVFVSIIYANHETGVVQNIAELVNAARSKNPNIVFHTDASQALGWIPCAPADLGVDLLTLSGYKIYGPKGVGVLYKKNDIKLQPQFPGFQEWGMRGGTESPALISGFAKALELTQEWDRERVYEMRQSLITRVMQGINGVILNTYVSQSVPHITHFSFSGADAQLITIALDRAGVAASPGSACSSGATQVSHVVEALRIDIKKYPGSLRLSLGVDTTEEEIEEAVARLRDVLSRLRQS